MYFVAIISISGLRSLIRDDTQIIRFRNGDDIEHGKFLTLSSTEARRNGMYSPNALPQISSSVAPPFTASRRT
jgi:hypothetical protein